jgi:P-type Ca2+ transporter type 2C
LKTADLNITFHSLTPEEVLSALDTDAQKGLSPSEVEQRQKQFGINNIIRQQKQKGFLILLSQFKSPIVILLLIAAALSFWFGEWIDAMAILIVLLVNAFIGFYMEFKAEKSMNALKKLSASPAKVIRNNQLTEIDSDQIVPGDIVYVEAGDLVPADGRIVILSQLQSDESPLTGESLPVEKRTGPIAADTTLAERSNMLYKGTYVNKGNSFFAVSGTGMNTEFGKIASLVQLAKRAATPLEKKLEEFSKRLIWVTVVLVIIIFIAGLLYGQNILEMLTTSIALAVAAIPEGLPIVATMALAQGMMKMAKYKVIVKRLSAVETLGGTSVICTDKTGTLTKNQIEVKRIIPASETAGNIIKEVSVFCNTAQIYFKDGEEKELGDPLEIGLLRFAMKEGMDINQIKEKNPKIKEEPFSSETKVMSTLHKGENGLTVYSKGAVEEILNRCKWIADSSKESFFDTHQKAQWLKEAENLASAGLRVIATAYKKNSSAQETLSDELIFAGLIGMADPPREEVFTAISECHSAGIKIVMITGDHPATAKNIASQLKISDNSNAHVLAGKEMKDFENLSDSEKDKWYNTEVFARVSPKQKLDIVRVFQEKGNVVAMTGDGVNDAPALKKADIGVAMGLRGTQVAQEVADMVIKDDSFSSIVLAIKQGRVIFENIRKFVVFLLSCNLSELLVISIAAIFNLHFQLFPLQILFINLITDVLPALALGVTAGSPSVMEHPPRNINEPIIDKARWKAIFLYSIVIGATSVGSVFISHFTIHNTESWNPQLSNNILFFSLIFSQLLHVFNMSNKSFSFFSSEIIRNKYIWYSLVTSVLLITGCYTIESIRKVLSLYEMSLMDWIISVGASFLSILIIQLLKKTKIINTGMHMTKSNGAMMGSQK